MYQLYIANKNYSSWSLRPWLVLKALNIPFKEHLVPFSTDPKKSSADNFQKFAPNSKVPCLHIGEQVIWDSLAIIEYLAEQHDNIWPESPAARAWARSACAEMHSGFTTLRTMCPMNCGINLIMNDIPNELKADLTRITALWSEGIERFGGPYLAGENFTAVDAFFAPVVLRIRSYNLIRTAAKKPEIESYYKKMLRMPALLQWVFYATAEAPEPEHEKDCLKYSH